MKKPRDLCINLAEKCWKAPKNYWLQITKRLKSRRSNQLLDKGHLCQEVKNRHCSWSVSKFLGKKNYVKLVMVLLVHTSICQQRCVFLTVVVNWECIFSHKFRETDFSVINWFHTIFFKWGWFFCFFHTIKNCQFYKNPSPLKLQKFLNFETLSIKIDKEGQFFL